MPSTKTGAGRTSRPARSTGGKSKIRQSEAGSSAMSCEAAVQSPNSPSSQNSVLIACGELSSLYRSAESNPPSCDSALGGGELTADFANDSTNSRQVVYRYCGSLARAREIT